MEKTSFETTVAIVEALNDKLKEHKRNEDVRQAVALEVIAETLLAMLVHIAYDSETKGKR
jgi:hypothetical protein